MNAETLEGFPYLPALRLRRAKPSLAVATSMFYDGNGGQNRRLEVFLNNAVSGKRQSGHTQIGGYQSDGPGKDRNR